MFFGRAKSLVGAPFATYICHPRRGQILSIYLAHNSWTRNVRKTHHFFHFFVYKPNRVLARIQWLRFDIDKGLS